MSAFKDRLKGFFTNGNRVKMYFGDRAMVAPVLKAIDGMSEAEEEELLASGLPDGGQQGDSRPEQKAEESDGQEAGTEEQ